MINIVLCCQNGASTDLLAVNIEKAAKEQNIDISVNAYPYTKLESVIDDADIILLAPQIRFKKASFEKQFSPKGKPFMCIEPTDYGLLNGKKVLDDCLKLIKTY